MNLVCVFFLLGYMCSTNKNLHGLFPCMILSDSFWKYVSLLWNIATESAVEHLYCAAILLQMQLLFTGSFLCQLPDLIAILAVFLGGIIMLYLVALNLSVLNWEMQVPLPSKELERHVLPEISRDACGHAKRQMNPNRKYLKIGFFGTMQCEIEEKKKKRKIENGK